MSAGTSIASSASSSSAPTSAETDADEPARLGLDIVGTLAERGDGQRQAFDAGEEGQRELARPPALEPGGALDRQDGGGFGLAADFLFAEPAVFAVLEERVEDRRAGRRQPVEVVEQDHPLARRGDQAGAVVAGVGEGAALVAEEDAAEQRLVGQLVARGDRQRGLPAVARRVEEAGQPALAGAALAVEQQAGQGPPRPAAACAAATTRSRADGPGRRPGPVSCRTPRTDK